MIFFDTESVGLDGPLVTIQWANKPDSDQYGRQIYLHEVWRQPLINTLNLIKSMTNDTVVGFNLVHDWFMLIKWYNVFRQLTEEELNGYPGPSIVRRVKEIEARGPTSTDLCLKPRNACDLMLLARAGKFQYLAKHKLITIRKIPRQATREIIRCLNEISLPEGCSIRWRESEKRGGRQDVVDVVGEFINQSSALKNIAAIMLNNPKIKEETFNQEVGSVPYNDQPDWMPWGGNWERALYFLQDRFKNEQARSYAIRDVEYTYLLWQTLDSPQGGDDDSELACLIGAARWKGFAIAPPEILLDKIKYYKEIENSAPTAPAEVMDYLRSYLSSTEQLILTDTKKITLEELGRWDGHPVQAAVKKVQAARRAQRRIDILRKLYKAGRFCFSMKVLGTLSSRMSGGAESGGGAGKRLNAQGIPREKGFRSLFPLSFEEEHLEGGDFDALEVTIADAVYSDATLHNDLLSGQSIHSITGAEFYSTTPDIILQSRGLLDSKYNRSKNGFFAYLYGAQLKKISNVLDLSESEAEKGVIKLKQRYLEISKHREKLWEKFTPLRQPNGPGTKIEWVEPEKYIESLLGFKRYFTLEWCIIRGLYSLANNMDSTEIKNIQGECRRTNRVQSISGACQSALYAAIFALQAHVFRAAANHEIQAVGAQLTKHLQRHIWDLQPSGISPWLVRPLNIHDEVLCPTFHTVPIVNPLLDVKSERKIGIVSYVVPNIGGIVETTIEKMKQKIPLLKMEWKANLKNWGEKE